MLIPIIGGIIFIFYSITNRAGQLGSLEGYPRWFQEMVIKNAGKQATKDQRKVFLS